MTWVGHVTHVEEKKIHRGFRLGNLKEIHHCEDIGLDGRVIFQWNVNK
jgi:hypothetical protein